MTPGGGGPVVGTGTLYGIVTDVTGGTRAGVVVSVGSKTSNTNSTGYFTMTNVAAGKVLVRFNLDGYVPNQQEVTLKSGGAAYMTPKLMPVGSEEVINSADGGIIGDEGGLVIINPDSLTGTPGDVTVQFTAFDPTDPGELGAFPGDFAGRAETDDPDEPFETYGYVNITVKQNGTVLDLKPGCTAEVHIPIPATLQLSAPPTIELWSYDEEAGYWISEGIATKEEPGHTYYWAIIDHFSYWNADQRYDTGYISGEVVDTGGNPVSGAYVKARAIGWRGAPPAWDTITDASGMFYNLPVKASPAVTEIYAETASLYSTPETTPGGQPPVRGHYRIPNLVLSKSFTEMVELTVWPSTEYIEPGKTGVLYATAWNPIHEAIPGKTFAWSSSNNSVATVELSGANVKVWGNALGTCIITVTCETLTATAEIHIAGIDHIYICPPSGGTYTGGTVNFAAQAFNIVGHELSGHIFEWSSSNTGIATLSASSGTAVYAWGKAVGSCTIYASCEGIIGSALLTISDTVDSVTIYHSPAYAENGGTEILYATAKNYSGASLPGRTFQWWSGNNSVATVGATGSSVTACGNAMGTCTIYASCEGVVGSVIMNVVKPWTEVGSPGPLWSNIFDLDIDNSSGTPYIVEGSYANYATVRRYYSSTWEVVGYKNISLPEYRIVRQAALKIYNGNPYVAYTDNNYKLYVVSYEAGAWKPLCNQTIEVSNGGSNYRVLDMEFDSGGVPYVAFTDVTPELGKATVIRYNSALSTWEIVGYRSFSNGGLNYLNLCINGGVLYVGYMDETYNTIFVMTYEAGSDLWTPKGQSSGISNTDNSKHIALFVDGGIPYVSYADGRAAWISRPGQSVSVKKYNPSTNDYDYVGDQAFSLASSTYQSIYVYGGVPYVAFSYTPYDSKTTVMSFEAGSGQWLYVGRPGISKGNTTDVRLLFYGGTPYVGHNDWGGNGVTVKRYEP